MRVLRLLLIGCLLGNIGVPVAHAALKPASPPPIHSSFSENALTLSVVSFILVFHPEAAVHIVREIHIALNLSDSTVVSGFLGIGVGWLLRGISPLVEKIIMSLSSGESAFLHLARWQKVLMAVSGPANSLNADAAQSPSQLLPGYEEVGEKSRAAAKAVNDALGYPAPDNPSQFPSQAHVDPALLQLLQIKENGPQTILVSGSAWKLAAARARMGDTVYVIAEPGTTDGIQSSLRHVAGQAMNDRRIIVFDDITRVISEVHFDLILQVDPHASNSRKVAFENFVATRKKLTSLIIYLSESCDLPGLIHKLKAEGATPSSKEKLLGHYFGVAGNVHQISILDRSFVQRRRTRVFPDGATSFFLSIGMIGALLTQTAASPGMRRRPLGVSPRSLQTAG